MTSQALSDLPQSGPIDLAFAAKNMKNIPINIPSTNVNILSPIHPTTPTVNLMRTQNVSQQQKTMTSQMPYIPAPISVSQQSPKKSPILATGISEKEKYTQRQAAQSTQSYMPELPPQIKKVDMAESGMHTTQRIEINNTHQTRTVNLPEAHIQYTQPPVHQQPKYKYVDQHGRPLTEDEIKIYEAKLLANYRVKFSILRDNYPNMKIPDIEEGTSIPIVEEMYSEYVKKIHIDSSVEQNKVYLLILWLILEIGCSKFFNLPMSGYTQNQMDYINKYQMLLIELGETSYQGQSQSSTPIEIRLLIMAIFNAVIFIGVKILSDKVSPEFAESLRESISRILMPSKANDVLHRAEQATADNIPPPMGEAKTPLQDMGNLGNILAQITSLFTTNSGPKSEPQVKKPTSVGGKKKPETAK